MMRSGAACGLLRRLICGVEWVDVVVVMEGKERRNERASSSSWSNLTSGRAKAEREGHAAATSSM